MKNNVSFFTAGFPRSVQKTAPEPQPVQAIASPQLVASAILPVADAANASGPASNRAHNQAPYPWILHPVIDLLFSCGGLFWLIVAYWALSGTKISLFGNASAFSMAFISIIGLQLVGDPHQPATLWRVYVSKPTRDKLGLPVALFGLAAIAVGLCTFFVSATTTFFLKLIIAWGFQHQLAQSYGVALIYCYKRGYYPGKMQKKIMHGMIQATIVYLVVRMFAIKDFGTYSINGYSMPFCPLVPEWVCTVAFVVMQLSILAFAATIVHKYVKQKQMFPIPGLMCLMTIVAMSYMSGNAFILLWGAFSTWWYHSAQYLVVTSAYYLKERGLPEGLPLSKISRQLYSRPFAIYFAAIFSAGFIVSWYFPHWMIEHGIPQGIAFAGIYVAINFHHFITDAFIWKLRDPQVQKLLIA